MWPLNEHECYVSVAIEADGPIPGPNSMLSIGAAALISTGACTGTFSANLETLPEARPDPATMRWWKKHPEAWTAARQDLQRPAIAMRRLRGWLGEQHNRHGPPVMVARALAYDAMWVRWYLLRFTGEDPFTRRGVDIRTLAMLHLGDGYHRANRSRWPTEEAEPARTRHMALNDALAQGAEFIALIEALRRARPPGTPAGG